MQQRIRGQLGSEPLLDLGQASRVGADGQTARVAGEFYLNAINVMRGAEAVSAYQPIDESEKFRIEYWELEEAKLRRRPKPRPLAGLRRCCVPPDSYPLPP